MSKKGRILLVEDEDHLRKVIKMNLELESYEVVACQDGIKALQLIENQYFDILLLDIMLPGINGLQICEKVRLKNKKVGIIFISAKDTSQDRITGLKTGADDYLSKPFQLEELLLRVQNLFKRSQEEISSEISEYTFGKNYVNFDTYEAKGVNGKFRLTQKELLLLKMLIEKKNEVVSRNHILQTVWGYDVYPSTRTIDNFIMNFRKYFEDDPRRPMYFESIRGIGYKFMESNQKE
ncbi:MAG TPA: response regulator transcription factor [Saprospiraceae bacterium]|nr:response regulator transcription factor [Saprospiraceae bacterium]